MTAAAIEHRHVSLEVHLPSLGGKRLLKTDEGAVLVRLCRIDQSVPLQDRSDRAGRRQRRRIMAFMHQQMTQLAWPPRRMLTSRRQHLLFDLIAAASRTVIRPARAITQGLWSLSRKACLPLVTTLAADPEAPAQLRNIGLLRLHQPHELQTLRHGR